MRTWGSINISHGIRIGRSYGPEDMGPPRLRQGLRTAAKARGEDMTKDVRWVRNWRGTASQAFAL